MIASRTLPLMGLGKVRVNHSRVPVHGPAIVPVLRRHVRVEKRRTDEREQYRERGLCCAGATHHPAILLDFRCGVNE